MSSDRRPMVVALLMLLAGCGEGPPPGTIRQVVEVKSLPEIVLDAAKKELPGVTFQDAWKNLDGSTKALHSYEVRGRNSNGKIREVRVDPAGKVLEVE